METENITSSVWAPWVPMTNPRDIKTLGKLIEETNELGSAAARCLIQGIDEVNPDNGKVNRQWLEDEIADVKANMELVLDRFKLNLEAIDRRVELKIVKLREWHEQLE